MHDLYWVVSIPRTLLALLVVAGFVISLIQHKYWFSGGFFALILGVLANLSLDIFFAGNIQPENLKLFAIISTLLTPLTSIAAFILIIVGMIRLKLPANIRHPDAR